MAAAVVLAGCGIGEGGAPTARGEVLPGENRAAGPDEVGDAVAADGQSGDGRILETDPTTGGPTRWALADLTVDDMTLRLDPRRAPTIYAENSTLTIEDACGRLMNGNFAGDLQVDGEVRVEMGEADAALFGLDKDCPDVLALTLNRSFVSNPAWLVTRAEDEIRLEALGPEGAAVLTFVDVVSSDSPVLPTGDWRLSGIDVKGEKEIGVWAENVRLLFVGHTAVFVDDCGGRHPFILGWDDQKLLSEPLAEEQGCGEVFEWVLSLNWESTSFDMERPDRLAIVDNDSVSWFERFEQDLLDEDPPTTVFGTGQGFWTLETWTDPDGTLVPFKGDLNVSVQGHDLKGNNGCSNFFGIVGYEPTTTAVAMIVTSGLEQACLDNFGRAPAGPDYLASLEAVDQWAIDPDGLLVLTTGDGATLTYAIGDGE